MLHHGLYEQVINNALTGELAEIPEARKSVAPIDKAEASKVLAQYLADVVQKGLDNVLDNGGDISAQIGLTNQIVDLIQNTTKEADFAALGVDRRAEQLLALLRETDPRLAMGKTAADIERPETSIAQSSLFTGAVHEPQMFTEQALAENGMDQVRFLMSANVGEELRPIHKIASGGELARIMLAMKNVLSEQDQVGTMVFDEVDTGVSGRAAQKVAEKMARISRTKQVLCVTHLPQLAAMADTHFSVEKGEQGGRTFTRVVQLDRARRQQELARLTGGASISATMLEGAGELLDQAEKFKKTLS